MSNRLDSEIRALVTKLMQMAPGAPPYPEENVTLVEKPRSAPPAPPWRRLPAWAAAAAVFVVALLVAIPLILLTGDQEEVADSTTLPTSTLDVTPTTTPTEVTPARACTAPLPTPGEAGTTYILVECGWDGDFPLYPLAVEVAAGADPLLAALEALVAGTTDDQRELGLFTSFDFVKNRDQIEVGVTVDGEGVARVELTDGGEPWEPQSDNERAWLIEPLVSTVFHSSIGVEAIDSPMTCFSAIGCELVTRDDWQATRIGRGVILSSRCDPINVWLNPDCRIETVEFPRLGVLTESLLFAPIPSEDFGTSQHDAGSTLLVSNVTEVDRDGTVWRFVGLQDDAEYGWIKDTQWTPDPGINAEPIDALVTFARDGDPAELSRAALAGNVVLGLGPDITRVVAGADLADRDSWRFDVEYYAGASGPFNLLDPFAQLGPWEIQVGPHNHCAGLPRPAPAGFEDHLQVSAQPVLGPDSSCLEWFTVDLFFNADGFVEAITVDWWEP